MLLAPGTRLGGPHVAGPAEGGAGHSHGGIPFEELTVSVASRATLYRMKRDTVRLKDRADAEMLKRRFNLKDEPCAGP